MSALFDRNQATGDDKMKVLPVDKHANDLIAKWNEAKANEEGWAEVRKCTEEALIEHYQEEIGAAMAALEDTTNLTTTLGIGTEMKMTVGNELKVDQVAAVEFLTENPIFLGLLFKAEYKPVTAAVITRINSGDTAGMALEKVCTFKDKRPSFAAA